MLQNFEIALEEVKTLLRSQSETVLTAHRLLLEGFNGDDSEKVSSVSGILLDVEKSAIKLDNDIIKILARFCPEGADLRLLVSYLKIVNNIVRVSNNIRSIAKRLKKVMDKHIDYQFLKQSISELHHTVIRAFEYAMKTIENPLGAIDTREISRRVEDEEERSDRNIRHIEAQIIFYARDEKILQIEYIDILHIIRKLERTADRAVDIASLMCFAQYGGVIRSV